VAVLVLLSAAVIVVVYAVHSSLNVTKAASEGNLSTLYSTGAGPLVGQKLPSFSLGSVVDPGASVNSKSLNGHPAIVNFFASWCIPCQKETPMLAKEASALGSKVGFLGVDEGSVRSSEMKFLQDKGVSYPVGFDQRQSLRSPFELVGLPTTVFVNAKGTIVSEVIGQLSKTSLDRNVSRLLRGARL
jgi:cytochrome c biogenesis protein CcmG/thiol:disulfide interchange protein DsbE